jgi:HK97 family phage major capsid protein
MSKRMDELQDERKRLVTEARKIAETGLADDVSDKDMRRYGWLQAEIERVTREIKAEGGPDEVEYAMRDAQEKMGQSNKLRIPEARELANGETFRSRLYGENAPVSSDKAFGEWFKRAVRSGGVPEMSAEEARDDMTGLTGAMGGDAIPTAYAADLIDLAMRSSVTAQAGARRVPMTARTVVLPRVTQRPQPAWRQENAAFAGVNLRVGKIQLESKSLAGVARVTYELLDDAPALGKVLRNELGLAMGLAFDKAALMADGTTNDPTGLYETTGLNFSAFSSVTHETVAAAALLLRKRDYQPNALILREDEFKTISMLRADGATGAYLAKPEYLSGVNYLPTNQIGGSAALAFLGDFNYLALGIRHEVRLMVDPYTYMASNGQIAILVYMRGDVLPLRIDAFEGVGTAPA